MRRSILLRPKAERGFALLVVTFMVLLLVGLSLGLVEEGLASRTSVRHHEANLRALEILEAGVVRSAQEIRAMRDAGTDGIGVVSGPLGGGAYAVTVVRDTINPDRWTLTARAAYGLSQRRVDVGVRRRAQRMFVEALFSQGNLVAGGSMTTDAYNSSLGSYASQAVNSDAYGTYALAGGDLGSNGTIQLNGSAATIRGDAIAGPFSTIESNGSPTITGDQLSRDYDVELAPRPISEFRAAMDAMPIEMFRLRGPRDGIIYDRHNCDLLITGGASYTLSSGTYFFRNLDVTGGSTLTFEGDVKIYITGSFDATGGTLVNSGTPSQLQVYANPYDLPPGFSPTSTEITLRGGSSLAMALYAPNANLTVQGGIDFYGAAVANSIKVGGDGSASSFHYDNSLGTFGERGIATLEQLFWREPAPPRR